MLKKEKEKNIVQKTNIMKLIFSPKQLKRNEKVVWIKKKLRIKK